MKQQLDDKDTLLGQVKRNFPIYSLVSTYWNPPLRKNCPMKVLVNLHFRRILTITPVLPQYFKLQMAVFPRVFKYGTCCSILFCSEFYALSDGINRLRWIRLSKIVNFLPVFASTVLPIEVFHKFAKLRNSTIMEENIRFSRGDSLSNSKVFFHNGGKLRNLANVKDLHNANLWPIKKFARP